MKDDEPHRVEDNESLGQQSDFVVTKRKRKRRISKLMVAIGFDENQKEFELWDYLYDVNTEHFEMEAIPDYENRIQYYEITADSFAIAEFRLWLIKKEIEYKFDKK